MHRFIAAVMLSLMTSAISLVGCGTLTDTVQEQLEPLKCQEDEPCWNCETMGNKICGPVQE